MRKYEGRIEIDSGQRRRSQETDSEMYDVHTRVGIRSECISKPGEERNHSENYNTRELNFLDD